MSRRAARFLSSVVLAGSLAGGSLEAQESSVYDDIWGLANWYSDEGNPTLQSVRFRGRFQYDYASLRDGDRSHDEWNVRRMRLGVQFGLLRQITIHLEAGFDPQDPDPFYRRLTDAYVEWSRSPTVAVTVGKQSAPFTMDGSTSSKELLTIDRSNLSNNLWFPSEYVPGVSLSGELSEWVYHGGIYSAGTANRELGEFDGSAFTLLTLGYRFAPFGSESRALARASYVYQDPDPRNTFTRPFQHVASANLDMGFERWGVRADVSAGAGYLGQSDVWGSMLMPWYDVTPGFQLVGRYTYLDGDGANSVRLARYENQLVDGRGDRYSELYVGANYYMYGHELKLQTGLQLGDMEDTADDGGGYSGVSFTTGIRVSW